MSMQRVAQLAGVSTATVSRVVNNHPRVAPRTAESVRQAMRELNVSPLAPGFRRRGPVRIDLSREVRPGTNIAFLVVGTPGTGTAPAFARLLEGVSAAVTEHGFSLSFGFVSDRADVQAALKARQVEGLLLHGNQPRPRVLSALRRVPTVWLMANRQRPTWGDQVMPDAAAAGEMAAKYLARQGHRRVAYVGRSDAWSMRLRAFTFASAAGDLGVEARIFEVAGCPRRAGAGGPDPVTEVASRLVDQLVAADPAPTGLFVGEDSLLLPLQLSLRARGNSRKFQVVSCNNEQPYFAGLQARPAAIDLRPEVIGRLGVEQLLWRMRNRNAQETVRVMVEPVLIEPIEIGMRPPAPIC